MVVGTPEVLVVRLEVPLLGGLVSSSFDRGVVRTGLVGFRAFVVTEVRQLSKAVFGGLVWLVGCDIVTLGYLVQCGFLLIGGVGGRIVEDDLVGLRVGVSVSHISMVVFVMVLISNQVEDSLEQVVGIRTQVMVVLVHIFGGFGEGLVMVIGGIVVIDGREFVG